MPAASWHLWLSSMAVLAASLLPAITARTTAVSLPDGKPYAIGKLKNVAHIWVDPTRGVDGVRRGTAAAPLKTFTAAWARVPAKPARPYHIHIQPGVFTQAITEASEDYSQVPEWLENKKGSYASPVIIEAVRPGTVTFKAFLNIRFCSYLYWIGLKIDFPGDINGDHPFHCEGCVGLLLRNLVVRGSASGALKTREAVKLNQCQGVYIEGCDIGVATDNAIDAVAVQYGHIIRSHLHTVGFGVYVKGGSAYILISGNRVHHTGELGIAAGFDTGLEWMVQPWVRYEVYDVRIVNNLIYSIDNAPGISVYGGYNVLVAHNTLWSVGARSALFGVYQGRRTCDGEIDRRCTQLFKKGAWGPPGRPIVEWAMERLPNSNVIIANNLVVNPAGYVSDSGAFYVPEPLPYCHEYSNTCTNPAPPLPQGLPRVVPADQGLVIRGNLIVNGPLGGDPLDPSALGISGDPGYETGCRSKALNPGCYPEQVVAQNAINSVAAELSNPEGNDFRPKAASLAGFKKLWKLPNWGQWAPGLNAPQGSMNNSQSVLLDFEGKPRTAANNAPGAYVRA